MENRIEVPQKLKIELLYDSAILLLGLYPTKRNEIMTLKTYMYSCVYYSIIHNNQDKKQIKCPSSDEWIKEKWYIHMM